MSRSFLIWCYYVSKTFKSKLSDEKNLNVQIEKILPFLQLLKTARNILIVNMAIADIFLCLFTMPLTLLDLLYIYWPFGSGQVKQIISKSSFTFFSLYQEMFCKLMSFTQSTFVFFSSVSVALIAVDRMLVIVYPDVKQISNKQVKNFWFNKISYQDSQAFLFSILSFFFCAIFSSPLFFMTKMYVLFEDASYCYEVFQKRSNFFE